MKSTDSEPSEEQFRSFYYRCVGILTEMPTGGYSLSVKGLCDVVESQMMDCGLGEIDITNKR